uniref:Uncharacterized protein n=1 Tax=Mycolicibacterium sp. CBMA 213 TaxID=1968788 RepID=A0A343VRR5_9MYCO|nr:hypothetical protein B5P44_p00294 [Mycolicibacterium sp. CBMA 213]
MQTRPTRTTTTVRVAVAAIRMRTVADSTRPQTGNGTKREILSKARGRGDSMKKVAALQDRQLEAVAANIVP